MRLFSSNACWQMVWTPLTWWACLLALTLPARAMDQAELAQRLASRIQGDRSDLCLQAAVIERGQVLRGAACANPQPGRAPADGAAFEIGSISKTMVAFLVADLVRGGGWQLSDPIAKHLPADAVVPRQGDRQITVADLVTHSASLPRLMPGFKPANPADPYADTTEASLLAALARTTLSGPIGSASSYSNFGMQVLSLAVARALGNDLQAAFQQRLFKPLGMRGAHVQPRPGAEAIGHNSAGKAVPPWTAATNLAGVGMVRATLDDMVAYAQAHLGLMDSAAAQSLAAQLALTRTPLAHGMGMNWFLPTVAGRSVISHGGATGGFSSTLVMDLAAQRAVVLLVDTESAGTLDDLAFSLLGLNVPLREARQPRPTPPELAAAVEGDYLLDKLEVRVWRDGGVLLGQASGQPAVRLLYDSRGDFYTEAVNATMRPLTDSAVPLAAADSAALSATAPVIGFIWTQGGVAVEAYRVGYRPVLNASNPAWRDWAGEYSVAPGFNLRVFERAGQLMLHPTGQQALAVEVTGPDQVEVKRFGAVLQFNRDASGQVVGASLLQNGRTLTGPKLPPEQHPNSAP